MNEHDDPVAATRAAYDRYAGDFGASWTELSETIADQVRRFAAAVGAGGRVLEIGSAGGRDALALEAAGLHVRRTDVSAGFVELLRSRGFPADRLDPLTDPLDDPEHPERYDGVWAQACLLHVRRGDLPVVLTRLAEATRPGGRLMASLKEGDGEGWSTHGAVEAPRHFTYWRAEPLREVVTRAGWKVEALDSSVDGRGQGWLRVLGFR